jgi:hypothetical protein
MLEEGADLALDAAALADLEAQIAAQGNVVRELKTALKDGKAEKAAVDAAVGVLVALKAKLPAEAAMAAPKSKKETKAAAPAAAPTAAPTAAPAAPTASAPATVGGDGGLAVSIDDVINVCKRRGIIFQSSEVYGGYAGFWDYGACKCSSRRMQVLITAPPSPHRYAGFWDYGPLGVELRANIKQAWWRDMVHRRDDVVGLDSSIIGSPKIWKASGHIDGFSDPMVDCRTSKLRFRADQLFWSRAEVDGQLLGYVSLLETDDMDELVLEAATKLQRKAGLRGTLSCTPVKDFTEASDEEQSFAHADVAAYGILVYVIVTHLQRLKTVGRNARDRRLERLITRQRSYLFLVRVVCVVHVDGCSGWCSNPPPHSHADVPDLCPWAQRVSEVEASSMHVGIADLITDCCQQDPNFRIGMDEVWAALAALERCPKAFLTCFQSMCCGRQACARLHAPEMRQLRHALELPPHAGVRCAETLPAGTTWICCENQVPRACVAVPMEGGWKPHCGWFRRTGCDSGGRILAGLSTNQERLVMLKPSVGPSLFQWQCKPSLWEFVCREGGVVISLRTALTDVD